MDWFTDFTVSQNIFSFRRFINAPELSFFGAQRPRRKKWIGICEMSKLRNFKIFNPTTGHDICQNYRCPIRKSWIQFLDLQNLLRNSDHPQILAMKRKENVQMLKFVLVFRLIDHVLTIHTFCSKFENCRLSRFPGSRARRKYWV